ncbi:hypothetical protein LG288_04420 [Idiomarina seosinensis]|uniref:pilus assembly protein TadG-related protein n=1 Tax=Idiomarina seosinensis TaxID=281739 RepID=UPI00384B5D07
MKLAASRTQQRGQTLMLMTVAIFLMVLLLLAATRMGEHARRQWYLQSVADNAAHSAAVLLSRQLNLAAVLNRALIGNQIAMAQWLGLASWLSMMNAGLKVAAKVLALIPGLQGIAISAYRLLTKIEHFGDQVIRGLILFNVGVVKAISLTQTALQLAMTAETPLSVGQVVDAHDSNLSWSLYHGGGVVPFPLLWWQFSTLRSTRKRKHSDDFRQLTLKSRDPFTRDRSYRWASVVFLRMQKAGGSALQTPANGRWNWNALDSLSVHYRKYGFFGKWKEGLPIAGSARGVFQPYWASRWQPGSYGNAFDINPGSSRIGFYSMRSYRIQQLPFSYWSLGRGSRYGANAVVVAIKDSRSGQISHARAEVIFSRPLSVFPRADNAQEKDNLFNALWEPQLVPLTAADKAAIVTREFVIDG